ncbi:hypothetical protein NL676_008197 [Syzygium grande]|nr:hypothetical protein NL676_008197 [Syzygium grande]
MLRKCKEAIGDKNNGQGKVIIMDIVIRGNADDAQETATELFFDVLMMTVVTGSERTEDWEKHLSEGADLLSPIMCLYAVSLMKSQQLVQIPQSQARERTPFSLPSSSFLNRFLRDRHAYPVNATVEDAAAAFGPNRYCLLGQAIESSSCSWR